MGVGRAIQRSKSRSQNPKAQQYPDARYYCRQKKAPGEGGEVYSGWGCLCSVCPAALVTLEVQRGTGKVDGITRFHKTGEAGSRPVLVLDRDTDHGEFVRVQSGFVVLLFDGDADDIVK